MVEEEEEGQDMITTSAAAPRAATGEHCKLHWKWVVDSKQPASTDGSLGVIMLLDHLGAESDEATTPAFR